MVIVLSAFEAPMGAKHVDPIIHARSIVRKCMVRDACTDFASEKGTHWIVALRSFRRLPELPSFEAPTTEPLTRSGRRFSKPTARLIGTTAFFVLWSIIIAALTYHVR